MAKNTGKNFENEIRKSLEKADLWWFRIQDTNDVSRFVKKAVAEKQPADFMAVYRSRPILSAKPLVTLLLFLYTTVVAGLYLHTRLVWQEKHKDMEL